MLNTFYLNLGADTIVRKYPYRERHVTELILEVKEDDIEDYIREFDRDEIDHFMMRLANETSQLWENGEWHDVPGQNMLDNHVVYEVENKKTGHKVYYGCSDGILYVGLGCTR